MFSHRKQKCRSSSLSTPSFCRIRAKVQQIFSFAKSRDLEKFSISLRSSFSSVNFCRSPGVHLSEILLYNVLFPALQHSVTLMPAQNQGVSVLLCTKLFCGEVTCPLNNIETIQYWRSNFPHYCTNMVQWGCHVLLVFTVHIFFAESTAFRIPARNYVLALPHFSTDESLARHW